MPLHILYRTIGITVSVLISYLQPAAAQTTYDSAIVIIAHDHRFSTQNFDGKNDFIEMNKGGVTAKVICVVTDLQDWKNGTIKRLTTKDSIVKHFNYPNWEEFYEGRVHNIHALHDKGQIQIIRNTKDLLFAKQKLKSGLIIGTEGVSFLNGSTEKLKQYHKQGLRHIQLYREPLPSGAALTEAGLTDFGKELITQCNTLGIAIDVTHVERLQNRQLILKEIINRSSKPVIVSHQHGKDFGGLLTDEEIIAVARSGANKGVIGIHFISNYVTPTHINTLVDVINHIKNLVGIEHVALGADYSPTQSATWVVSDITDVRELAELLHERGFTTREIRMVLGENMVNFYKTTWNEL